MAMTNGTFEITSRGTLMDFFEVLKTAILQYTDWNLVEDECTEIKLVFKSDKIPNAKIVIADSAITSVDSTASSSTLRMAIYDSNGKSATYTTLSYSSGNNLASTSLTRTIYLSTFGSIYLCEFLSYSNTTPSVSKFPTNTSSNTVFWAGAVDATNISTGEVEVLYPLGSGIFKITDTAIASASLTVKVPISGTSGGVVMISLLLGSSTAYSYALCNVYNSSTVTSGMTYSINGKKYLAINSSTLIEVQ